MYIERIIPLNMFGVAILANKERKKPAKKK